MEKNNGQRSGTNSIGPAWRLCLLSALLLSELAVQAVAPPNGVAPVLVPAGGFSIHGEVVAGSAGVLHRARSGTGHSEEAEKHRGRECVSRIDGHLQNPAGFAKYRLLCADQKAMLVMWSLHLLFNTLEQAT